MLDENKVKMSREIYLKNPYWRKVYDSLTPGARRRYDLSFLFGAASIGDVEADANEAADALHEYESQMSYDDLCSLLPYAGNSYECHKLKNLIVAAAEREDKTPKP